MNWLLIVVVAILVINSLIGMKAGMIKTIFSLCSMVIALFLTIWLSPYVNDYMRGNDKIYEAISTKVEKVLPVIDKSTDKNEQVTLIEGMSLPKPIKDALIENNNADAYKKLAVKSFKDYIKGYVTGIVINALAFSLTFIVILILLWVISIALDIISKLPLLNQINKLAGLVAGFVHGVILVWLLFIILTVFSSSEIGQKAMVMISENQFLSLLYNYNYLLNFVIGATKILM
jgi:Colicin V production protein.